MEKIGSTLSMFCFYSKISIKSWFQYKFNACIQSFTVFLRESTNIMIIYLTLLVFDNINGWDKYQLFFLYSLLYITYGILIIFCTGLRDFDGLVLNGTFDRFMLRPQGLLLQVIASNSDWFAALGHGGLGIVLFIVSANRVGVVWNFQNIMYYVITIIAGTMIQVALFMIFATLSFYTIKSDNIRNVLYWNLRKFAGYPISVFKYGVQLLLMFVVPFAFVNYFPAQYLIRNDDMSQYPYFFIYLSPVIAGVMIVLAYLFWKISLRHYNSTGS